MSATIADPDEFLRYAATRDRKVDGEDFLPLSALEASGTGVRASWIERGSGQCRTLDAAEVVNCSGPDYDVTRSREALWINLLARGLVIPDRLRLGIRTGPGG